MKYSLIVLLIASSLFAAETPDTVNGTLNVNGKKFPLTHIYGRKREAWPADAKQLGAESVDDLTCGIVEVLLTNEPLGNAAIAKILQNDYQGSKTIRGVRLIIDGSGKYKWTHNFLLESGSVEGFGVTQTSGSITGGRRFSGNVETRNEQVNDNRAFSITFDVRIKPGYAREAGEEIPAAQLTDEFVRNLQGDWTVAQWSGVGCWSATGTLSVTEHSSPHQFTGTFHLEATPGGHVDEDVTISLKGNKVHFEGGHVSVPESIWTRDVFDLELRKDMLIGDAPDSTIVLKKVRE